MKKLKPILAIIVALSILLFSGCANIQALIPNADSDFYEIKSISNKADIIYAIDISGDNILLLTSKGIENYKLFVYDALSNRITAEKSLDDCPLDYISGAIFNSDNEIYVYDEGNEKAVVYDLNLNQTGTADHEVVYDRELGTELINDTFTFFDTYAFSYQGSRYCFVFYDDLENIYFFDGENEAVFSANGKKLFTAELNFSENTPNSNATVYVKDVENGLCINSMKLESVSGNLTNDIPASAISDKYVCFSSHVSNNQTGGSKNTLYLWKYTEKPTNEKIEIKSMTANGLLEDNERITKELKDKYGINVYANKKPNFGFEVVLSATPLQINNVLSQLSDCLALFPENFVKEIYKDAVDGLNIYIVDFIDGATAFANDFLEEYEICFDSHGGFSKTVAMHELMHLIDNRIITYYDDNGVDFIDEWKKLNPADFEYGIDDKNPEEHFVSYYAMTAIDEDLADTFQTMYEAYIFGGDHRLEDYEFVRKKADLLCEGIRKAYPSMANAKDVCWEKYAEFGEQ